MNIPASVSRRRFLATTAAGAAIGLPQFVPAEALSTPDRPGANDRVNVAVVGVGMRGRSLIADMPAGAQVVALCDCFKPRMTETIKPPAASRFAKLLAKFVEADAARCVIEQDYRRLFDKVKLDGVMIATPDHHHILAAILACQAGLDIYVEKPLTLTIAEGRRLVDAVARHKRVCQVGSQQRSMEYNRFACQMVRDGKLGRVKYVVLANLPGPMTYRSLPSEPMPEGMDWDAFCGPAPLRPYSWTLWQKDERVLDGKKWRGWDMWRDYSGHLLTNWGGHSVDQMQWALGMDSTGPVEIWPLLEGYRGEMRRCPVAAKYANGIEARFEAEETFGIRIQIYGERGSAFIGRNDFRFAPGDLIGQRPDPQSLAPWKSSGIAAMPHIANWLDCIKTRGTPNAPVEIGHRTATICHLMAICRELKRKLQWDPQRETFAGDAEANALLDRPRSRGYELPG